MHDYNLTEKKIIVRDMENALAINSILLYTKKVIYTCMKKEKKPTIYFVKNDLKNFYCQEK